MKLHQGFNFKEKVIVDRKIRDFEKKGNKDTAEITSYKANQVIIKTRTENDLILMLTDTNYPGWNVIVNGNPSELLLANGIFKAVVVPKGESIVKFIYEPSSFKIGAVVSVSSLFAIILLLIFRKFINLGRKTKN